MKSFSHKISDTSDALLNDYKNIMGRINTIETEIFSCCEKSEEKSTTRKPPMKRFTTTRATNEENQLDEKMIKRESESFERKF